MLCLTYDMKANFNVKTKKTNLKRPEDHKNS